MNMQDAVVARHELVAGEVRAWLGRRQRSGASVARDLGWTEIYMSRRLTGKIPFDVTDLEALAQLLGVPIGVFFEVPENAVYALDTGGRPVRMAAGAPNKLLSSKR